MEIAQQIGLILVILLMVFAFYNDLIRIFSREGRVSEVALSPTMSSLPRGLMTGPHLGRRKFAECRTRSTVT